MITITPQALDRVTSGSHDEAVIYHPPSSWPANNRTRQYLPLSKRHYSRENDLAILRRSVDILLKKQDERGSFYTDAEYRGGDKVDDQLGGASMLAFFLSQTQADKKTGAAIERAVRFHLDHHVWQPSRSRPVRYSRYRPDQEESGDWCNTLWCLWGASLVLRHGAVYLTPKTANELRSVLADYWTFVSTFPTRDENPCHNQLVAYCHIGILYARTVGNKEIAAEVSRYYHERLRRLRILDRGHWIYAEFNQWDPHYGLVSWMALESLYLETGEAAYAEDAEQMALYFNERVSAGGYLWGGSRHNEGGLDEFVHLPSNRAIELGLDRLLLPEPSHLWRNLAMDAHVGRTLVTRMELPLPTRRKYTPSQPGRWHFQKGDASVCLRDDTKMHHVSAAGLEIIPTADPLGFGSGVIWMNGGAWKRDMLQVQPPRSSEGHHYVDSGPIQLRDITGLWAIQRGYHLETRQWWLSTGTGLLWIGQLVSHGAVPNAQIDFILGNPVLTRTAKEAVPVAEVETAEGAKADTQDGAMSVGSQRHLKFGDVYVGATGMLEFIRPAKDAFHTFPSAKGWNLRDFDGSNEMRVRVMEGAGSFSCRSSHFFAVEIGRKAPSLVKQQQPEFWRLEAAAGVFEARQTDGIWAYTFETPSGREELPQTGFGFRHPSREEQAEANGLEHGGAT